MSRISRGGAWAGRSIAIASAILGTAAMTSAALVVATPALTVTPDEGPTGTSVSAVATGFGECPLAGNDDVGDPEVAFTWVGDETSTDLGIAPVSSGLAQISFDVPTDAAARSYSVTARCLGDDEIAAEAGFRVTEPPTQTVIVPDLRGRLPDEAATILADADLVLGDTEGSGDRVVDQRPSPGDEVPAQTTVDISLGDAPQELVDVPDVIGQTLTDAQTALETAGLEAGNVSGTGERVEAQSPAPGDRVLPGTPVALTLGADVVSTAADPPWLLIVLLGVAAVILIGVAARGATVLLRAQHDAADRRWVADHVRAEPVHPIESITRVAEDPGGHADHIVRIEPHPGERHEEMQEIRP